MNHSFSVPFAKISLQSISKNELHFFKNLYFEENLEAPIKITFDIAFQANASVAPDSIIAGKTSRSRRNFIITDTKGKLCSIDVSSLTQSYCKLHIEHGFDLYFAFTFIIEPLLIILSAANNIAYLHASAVANTDNKALVFSAWRHTGKTHRVLALLGEGHSFIGDDYTVFSDGIVYSYPKQINLFSYNFSQFPNLLSNLSFITCFRLGIFLALQKMLLSLSKTLSGSLAKTFFRLSELTEVATNITLNPKDIGATASSAQLEKLSILITGNSEKVSEQVSRDTATNKLFSIISYELQDFFSLYLGYQYLFDEKISVVESFEKNYQKALVSLPNKITVEMTSTQEKD